MAEGWGKALLNDQFSFYSAGTKKHGLNEKAVKVMSEVGIDISAHESNTLDEFDGINFDIVYTVCSDAHENCPIIPGANIIHAGFDDPPRLTQEMIDNEEVLNVYRRVRDEIKNFVSEIPNSK
mgnify:CR=1 FL=1